MVAQLASGVVREAVTTLWSVSVPVDVAKFAEQINLYGTAGYVLSVRDDHTPHIAHVTFTLANGELRCGASRSAAANVASRSRISLLWPPTEPGGYSMIVDGDARIEGDELVVVPVSGVLHRPAQPNGGPNGASHAEPTEASSSSGACQSDCAPIS